LGFALAFPFSATAQTISGFETFGDNQFVTPITAFPRTRALQVARRRQNKRLRPALCPGDTLASMRAVSFFVLALSSALLLRAADQSSALAAAQRLFDAMKTHDAAAAGALFVAGATLAQVDAAGKASIISADEFVKHIGSSKSAWLERIWNPKVFEHGTVAVVWAEHDFHLDGKFSHCGIDSFSLLKTDAGWRIASISDTHEKSNCPASPLGPPSATP
jgi:hypothetical protein